MPDQLAPLLVAHAGHWIVWVLYALPVIAVCIALWISSRRAPDGEEPGEGEDPVDREAGGSGP